MTSNGMKKKDSGRDKRAPGKASTGKKTRFVVEAVIPEKYGVFALAHPHPDRGHPIKEV